MTHNLLQAAVGYAAERCHEKSVLLKNKSLELSQSPSRKLSPLDLSKAVAKQ